jgi:hypothetical protein
LLTFSLSLLLVQDVLTISLLSLQDPLIILVIFAVGPADYPADVGLAGAAGCERPDDPPGAEFVSLTPQQSNLKGRVPRNILMNQFPRGAGLLSLR